MAKKAKKANKANKTNREPAKIYKTASFADILGRYSGRSGTRCYKLAVVAGRQYYGIQRYGYGQPNVAFIVSDHFEVDPETRLLVDPIGFKYDEVTDEICLDFKGDAKVLYGDYWITPEGVKCFRPRPKHVAKNMMIRVNWSTKLGQTGNTEAFADKIPGVLHFKHAPFRGEGNGRDFWIVEKGFSAFNLDQRIDQKISPAGPDWGYSYNLNE